MPRQSAQQLIGREGERWFQSRLPSGWILQKPTEDIGLDGVVVISDGSRYDGLEFRVQVKSSRHWKQNDSGFLLKNLNRESVLYWLTGFSPTLLILYSNKTKSAHWYWANRISTDSWRKLHGTSATISIRVPAQSQLDEDSWETIAAEVAGVHNSFVRTLSNANASRGIFQLLNSLHSSLLGIHTVQSAERSATGPISAPTQQLLCHLELVSHRDVILALRRFEESIPAEGNGRAVFTAIADRYQSRCAEFVRPTEAFLASSHTTTSLCDLCLDDMVAYRDSLVGVIVDTLHKITKTLA